MATLTIRMADDDYEALQALALITGQSMAAIVRAAIGESITRASASGTLEQLMPDELKRREHAIEMLRMRRAANAPGARMAETEKSTDISVT